MSNIMNIDIELSGTDVGFIFKDLQKKKKKKNTPNFGNSKIPAHLWTDSGEMTKTKTNPQWTLWAVCYRTNRQLERSKGKKGN